MDLLIVTDRSRLSEKYGKEGWAKINAGINAYLDALQTAGLDAVVAYMDGKSTPKAIKRAIHDHYAKLAMEHLLILGGDDIIPFYRLPDETPGERHSQEILSDSFYADFDENEADHFPVFGVGRFPDGGKVDLLCAQCQRAAAWHSAGGLPWPSKYAGFSTQTWERASRQTFGHIDRSTKALRLCPPWGLRPAALSPNPELVTADLLPTGGILFFNLHGHPLEPRWWGAIQMAKLQNQELATAEVIDQALLAQADLSDCLVLSEACHAAAIHGRTPENSLALCALTQGAAAFFGCTTESYTVRLPDGLPHTQSGIDALFSYFIFQIANKRQFGAALGEAKRYFKYNTTYDIKNMLSLVLFGDPTLRFQ